jgi:hypothetical protein
MEGGATIDREIEMEEAPISQNLKDRFEAWADWFDSILKMDDPASSKWPSEEDKASFVAQGYSLWNDRQQELGQEFVMFYKDIILEKYVSRPGYSGPGPLTIGWPPESVTTQTGGQQ